MNKPTNCPKCNKNTFWHNEGVSKNTGKPYSNNKCKECGHLEWLPSKGSNSSSDASLAPKWDNVAKNPMNLIAEELGAINQRLDNWEIYFKEQLGQE